MTIDILAGTEQQAVVARALEARHPDRTARDHVLDAHAVLLAIDEYYGARESDGDLLAASGLGQSQEIRARALDSAAKLLGPCLGEVIGEAPSGVVLAAAGDEWLRLAVNGARYIESGLVLPELADG
jgi:hypothetical protein